MATCPECGNKVAKDKLKAHQRRVHGGEEAQRTRGPRKDTPVPAAAGFPWMFVGVGLVAAIVVTAALYFTVLAPGGGSNNPPSGDTAVIVTNYGTFTIEFYPNAAPRTVAAFKSHISKYDFDNTRFHRVFAGYVIQGGNLASGVANPIVPWEDTGGLLNTKYTLAMARSDDGKIGSDPNTATSSFFVNLKDNTNLDRPGYYYNFVVFGKVIDGTSVIETIASVPTGPGPGVPPGENSVPLSPVTVSSIRLG